MTLALSNTLSVTHPAWRFKVPVSQVSILRKSGLRCKPSDSVHFSGAETKQKETKQQVCIVFCKTINCGIVTSKPLTALRPMQSIAMPLTAVPASYGIVQSESKGFGGFGFRVSGDCFIVWCHNKN